jgi:RimJ/RimL family protein N-acetyltransferase
MKVYLRAFELNDSVLFHKFRNDDEIFELITGNKYFVSFEREKKWVEEKIFNDQRNIYLSICLKDNDRLIGYASINEIDYRNRSAQWGSIIIDKSEQGKGLSIAVGQLLLKLVFEELGLNRFYSYINENHIGSLKMVEKLGFKQEGLFRENIFKLNRFHNCIAISILKSEYELYKISAKK